MGDGVVDTRCHGGGGRRVDLLETLAINVDRDVAVWMQRLRELRAEKAAKEQASRDVGRFEDVAARERLCNEAILRRGQERGLLGLWYWSGQYG